MSTIEERKKLTELHGEHPELSSREHMGVTQNKVSPGAKSTDLELSPTDFSFHDDCEAKEAPVRKNSSLTTILSVWNTIMGSSLLTMPWAFEKAGFTQTFMWMTLCGLMAFYTAYLITSISRQVMGKHKLAEGCYLPEYQTLCKIYLGTFGEYLSLISSNLIIFGCLMAYYVLMSKFLFGTGISMYKLIHSTNETIPTYVDDKQCVEANLELHNITGFGVGVQIDGNRTVPFSSTTSSVGDIKWTFSKYWDVNKSVPLYILLVFGLCMIRDPSFFSRFSAFGTLTVIVICFAAGYKAIQWGIVPNVDFSNPDSMHYITQFKFQGTVVLPGILSMGYFSHSGITTLMRDNYDLDKNGRDLAIAYFLVYITYTLLGVIFYVAYPGWKNCITDMFIENFDRREWIVPLMNGLMFIRILTVYPLLSYILRIQNSVVFYKKDWPGYPMVVVENIILLSSGCLAAMFYDHIGDIVRYSGSLCAAVLMFFLPCAIKLMNEKEVNGKIGIFSLFIHSALIIYGIVNFILQIMVPAY